MKDKAELSALDAYMNRVFKAVVIIIPSFCVCASSSVTLLHFLKIYPGLNTKALLLFDLSTLIYLAVGIYFALTGFTADGIIIPKKLKAAKITMASIIIIQWNAISYVWPFTDFWGFAPLFVVVFSFFFDERLVLCETIGIVASMLVSWLICGDMLLPTENEYFLGNIIYRFIGFTLMLGSINLLTYFGGKCLVEELEKYANYDTLTHLLNRKSMDTYIDAAYSQAAKNSAPFCLLMIDIDDFKRVNDTYGHDCGDEVLRYVANTVSCGVKKQDNVFRWGGEEILILLRANKEQAVSAAERIRHDIAKDPVNYRGEFSVPVTVTIGVAPYSAGKTVQNMMDDADKNLYYGKRHGKNQVVCDKADIPAGE